MGAIEVPVCGKCFKLMRCVTTGFTVATSDFGPVYSTDLFECRGCGSRVLTHSGSEPFSEDPHLARAVIVE